MHSPNPNVSEVDNTTITVTHIDMHEIIAFAESEKINERLPQMAHRKLY